MLNLVNDHEGASHIQCAPRAGLCVVCALSVFLVSLPPPERISFVLHDIFDVPFDTVAAILGRSTPATKMLASRARSRVRLGAPAADTHAAARNVVDAFLT